MARLRVADLELEIRTEGSDASAPLLLLHGFLGSGAEMLEAGRRLTPARRLIAVDLPGHGRSSAPARDAAYRFEAVVDALSSCAVQLGLAELDLWGYSLGGRLALALAFAPRIRIRRLILESCSPGISDPAERAARCAEDDARAGKIRDDLEGFLSAWERQPLFAGEHRRITREQSQDGLARAVSMLSPGRQPPLHERLGALKTPTLWLSGQRDVRYGEIARDATAQMPSARHVVIRDAGHAPHREQPQATASAVSDFLQE